MAYPSHWQEIRLYQEQLPRIQLRLPWGHTGNVSSRVHPWTRIFTKEQEEEFPAEVHCMFNVEGTDGERFDLGFVQFYEHVYSMTMTQQGRGRPAHTFPTARVTILEMYLAGTHPICSSTHASGE
jgi:hypothetical protein